MDRDDFSKRRNADVRKRRGAARAVVLIGSGPRLVRLARALQGEVRCIDVHRLNRAYGADVAGEVVCQITALASR